MVGKRNVEFSALIFDNFKDMRDIKFEVHSSMGLCITEYFFMIFTNECLDTFHQLMVESELPVEVVFSDGYEDSRLGAN